MNGPAADTIYRNDQTVNILTSMQLFVNGLRLS